jgi:hypothetical protein
MHDAFGMQELHAPGDVFGDPEYLSQLEMIPMHQVLLQRPTLHELGHNPQFLALGRDQQQDTVELQHVLMDTRHEAQHLPSELPLRLAPFAIALQLLDGHFDALVQALEHDAGGALADVLLDGDVFQLEAVAVDQASCILCKALFPPAEQDAEERWRLLAHMVKKRKEGRKGRKERNEGRRGSMYRFRVSTDR